METIPLNEITSENNRKYTKDTGFEQLVNSIREYGICEPPIVRRLDDQTGYYVIAGRRRIAAARQLNFTAVECIIREDDASSDEGIALAENVNRLEMHPLDEAAAFGRMADNGSPIEEIAQYYARSPSAIYKRLRLASLTEELKIMFRDGGLNTSGAALLAELPEEDQREFSEEQSRQYEVGAEIPAKVITGFIHKRQRFAIRDCMAEGCGDCPKRTHNQGNDLFEEFAHLDDVCLDGDCYRQTWHRLIEDALEEKMMETASFKTDAKICFRSRMSGGIPELLYKKADHVVFFSGDDAETRFEVLREKGYEIESTPVKKKTGCCWLIGEEYDYDAEACRLTVERVAYKPKPPEETEKTEKSHRLQEYTRACGRELVEHIAAGCGETPEALTQKLDSNPYAFRETIQKAVIKQTAAARAAESKPRDYFHLFMTYLHNNMSGRWIESNFDDSTRKLFETLTGKKRLADIAVPDEVQKLFHFMLANTGFEDIPNLEDLKEIEEAGGNTDNLFYRYAGLSPDEYRALYLDAAREAADALLKPPPEKPAKGKKKKIAAPENEDEGFSEEDPF